MCTIMRTPAITLTTKIKGKSSRLSKLPFSRGLRAKKNTWEPRPRLDLSRQLTAGLNIELTLRGEILKWKESCKPSALCTFALGSVQI